MANHVRYRLGHEISAWPVMKFAQARRHMGLLQAQIEVYVASTARRADLRLAEDHMSIDTVLRIDAEPPVRELSLTLGDAIHCLRSAFDALTWELAHLDGANPNDPRAIQFPITTRSQDFTRARQRMETVPEPAWDRIEHLQPYNDETDGPNWLALLHKLDIIDKHRSAISTSVQVGFLRMQNEYQLEDAEVDEAAGQPEIVGNPEPRFRDGEVLSTWRSPSRIKELASEPPIVAVDPMFVVSLGDGGRAQLQQVLGVLWSQAEHAFDYVIGAPKLGPVDDGAGEEATASWMTSEGDTPNDIRPGT